MSGVKETIYVDFVFQPIVDSSRNVTAVFLQGSDVTQQYLSQQALLAADRQKDRFIATLAHELRNPLAPVRTSARILHEPNLSEALTRTSAQIIERQVEHMARLLDDLLDVARITQNRVSLDVRRVSVASIVEMAIEASRPLVEKKRQRIEVSQDEFIAMNADPVRITQVVTNLLINAAKFSGPASAIQLHIRRDAAECVISIRDEGKGIKPGALTSVFGVFNQEYDVLDRAEGGLGIGLGLVKGLVELHHGKVDAFSEGLGRGSTFTVRLPCRADRDVGHIDTASKSPSPQRAPLKILLADDNADMADSLSALLSMFGHQTFTAADGVRAFELARTHHPDLAILDVGMPGMTGYALASAIRDEEWGRTIVLIAATGWGGAEDKARALAAGFNFHLTKPFDMTRLEKLILDASPRAQHSSE